ncbi:MAG TPA: cytochrome P450 [Trebonia sp.]|jgi:cytochrome P450|nr:cytochrome P450 [Trebonia sp.]
MDIDSIDYTDPSRTPDPYRMFDYLAEHQPVYREPHHGVVLVTGHEELISVLRAPDVFSSATLIAGPDPWSLLPERPQGDDITDFISTHREYLPQNDQIVTADPPVHTGQRALLMGLITPKRLKENEEFIWRLTDRQLDTILARGRAEIMADYAQPYTLLVIADLLGVPEKDHAALLGRRDEGRRMPGSRAQGDEAPRASGHNTLDIFYDYFSARVAERREQPRGDVLTGMAQSLFPDGTVPEPIEVARIASNLFAAGQETTVRLIGTALRRIADEPETQAELRASRDLISRFVEETLRTEGPILGEYRIALKATELGGVHIPAGTQVFLANGAANRDPRQFECPAEFRVRRDNARRHVAFGHGIHTCPGAPLARSEARITIERLLDRTTGISIDEDVHGPAGARRYDYLPTHMFRGLTSLHLNFTGQD